jgi:RNA polymerase-binding transcription factor DksA
MPATPSTNQPTSRRRHAPRAGALPAPTAAEAARAQLVALRDALRAQMGDLAQPDGDSARPRFSNHLAEDAQEQEQREGDAVVRRFLQRDLDQIEHALAHLERGRYGLCEVCGQQIAPRRLEVLPAATLCVQCQARQEASRAPH